MVPIMFMLFSLTCFAACFVIFLPDPNNFYVCVKHSEVFSLMKIIYVYLIGSRVTFTKLEQIHCLCQIKIN